MKKIALALVGTAIAAAGFAQTSIVPEVGFNSSLQSTKIGDNDAEKTDALPGFNVGVGAQFDISKGLYVKPAIQYHMLGSQTEILGAESKTTLHQLRIPVNLGYGYSLPSNSGKLFVEAGPYIGYTIAGQTKVTGVGIDNTTDLEFGTEPNEFNPLDWGFNFGLGYETPWGVFIKGGYGLGLGNMSNVDDVKMTNQHWSVNLGYKINL